MDFMAPAVLSKINILNEKQHGVSRGVPSTEEGLLDVFSDTYLLITPTAINRTKAHSDITNGKMVSMSADEFLKAFQNLLGGSRCKNCMKRQESRARTKDVGVNTEFDRECDIKFSAAGDVIHNGPGLLNKQSGTAVSNNAKTVCGNLQNVNSGPQSDAKTDLLSYGGDSAENAALKLFLETIKQEVNLNSDNIDSSDEADKNDMETVEVLPASETRENGVNYGEKANRESGEAGLKGNMCSTNDREDDLREALRSMPERIRCLQLKEYRPLWRNVIGMKHPTIETVRYLYGYMSLLHHLIDVSKGWQQAVLPMVFRYIWHVKKIMQEFCRNPDDPRTVMDTDSSILQHVRDVGEWDFKYAWNRCLYTKKKQRYTSTNRDAADDLVSDSSSTSCTKPYVEQALSYHQRDHRIDYSDSSRNRKGKAADGTYPLAGDRTSRPAGKSLIQNCEVDRIQLRSFDQSTKPAPNNNYRSHKKSSPNTQYVEVSAPKRQRVELYSPPRDLRSRYTANHTEQKPVEPRQQNIPRHRVCRYFNIKGCKKSKEQCDFYHVCNRCFSPAHGSPYCEKLPENTE